jgi:hypothetical protein
LSRAGFDAVTGWTILPWRQTLPQPTIVPGDDDDRSYRRSTGACWPAASRTRPNVVSGGHDLSLLERPALTADFSRPQTAVARTDLARARWTRRPDPFRRER